MHLYSLSWLLRTVAGLASVYGVYRLYLWLQRRAAHQQFIIAHACKPTKDLRLGKYPFGIDFLSEELRTIKEHIALETYRQRFQDLDTTTFSVSYLHLRILMTCEPENIKSILATDFKSYSVGEERKKSLRPILGDGIFNSEGAAWQHSREMLRPCFARSQIGDIDLFEKHFQHLLKLIPRDGSTVDLQDLFFKLTLDIATEFLFGDSTHTLVPDERRPEDGKFVDAFAYAQNQIEAKSSVLSLFLPDRKFKRSCKYIHGEFIFSITIVR